MSKAAKEYRERVREQGCVLCKYLDVEPDTTIEIHHPREGQGMAQRASDFLSIPICAEHHRGASGIHGLGTRGFYNRYRLDEMDLLAMAIEGMQ